MNTTDLPAWAQFLVRAGCQAPSADNSQPWRFVWEGKVLTLHMDNVRGLSGLGLDHPANLMAMGAVVENLAQAAGAIGMPDRALTFGVRQNEDPFATIAWDGPVQLPSSESDLGLFRRHTNRGPYATTPLDRTLTLRLAAMFEGSARTVVLTEPAERRRLVRLVHDASKVRFQTEEIHRWLGASLRFTQEEVERGDGLDVATLLLPPGATALLRYSLDWQRMAFMNRFGAYKLFAALEAAMLQKCAALVMVVGTARDSGGAVAAGRLLERLWIVLNDAGFAVHPYYVLSDQLYRLRAGRVSDSFRPAVTALAGDVAALLGSTEETIFMVLRVGLPKVAEPVRSRRLPVSVTFPFSRMQ